MTTIFGTGPLRSRWLAATTLATAFGGAALAQCTTNWESMGAMPVTGTILAMASWDPDGPGPLSARIAVVGQDLHVHGAPCRIASCDLGTSAWSTLATDPDGPVQQLVGLGNGDLAVAGSFSTAGGVAANGIARWNGSTWAPLGAGLTVAAGQLQVRALAALSNGDLVVAGSFTAAGGVAASGLARWNGSSWAAIPATVTGGNQHIAALVALPNGEFAVGGDFTAIDGVAAASVARWNGATWVPFAAGFDGGVHALAITGNGALVASGYASTGGRFVSQWNGSMWLPLAGLSGSWMPTLVAGLPGNGVAVAGTFTTIGGVAAMGVAAWDGVAWAALGAGLPGTSAQPNVSVLTSMLGGQLVAVTDYGPTRWDGAAWRPLAIGPRSIRRLLPEPDGSLLAAGSFVTATGHSNLCRWGGAAWTPVATPFQFIRAMARRTNGNLVIAGEGLAEWNGSSWSSASNLYVYEGIWDLLPLPDGDILVAGEFAASTPPPLANSFFNIARWNGSTWSGLGSGLGSFNPGHVRTLALLPNGDVLAGGDFSTVGIGAINNIARWNGATWSPLGGGTNGTVTSLAVAPNGDVHAAGFFSQAGGVPAENLARWNGAAWSAMPGLSGLPAAQWFALAMLPGSDVVAVGTTLPSATAQPLVARWDGAGWTRLDAGLVGGVISAAFGAGGLYVGGALASAGGSPATGIVRLVSTCPATVLPWGSGCDGRTLVASAPWLGGTLQTTGTGPAGPAVGCLVTGFSPTSVPLQTILPAGLPGCTLIVQADHLELVAFNGGVASSSWALPDSAALTGIAVRQQLVAFELAGAYAVTTSNALLLTLGSF